MYHDSTLPAGFLSSKEKMAPPFLMASLRSASLDLRDWEMASKAEEEGKSAMERVG
jgi:hypothetical protein